MAVVAAAGVMIVAVVLVDVVRVAVAKLAVVKVFVVRVVVVREAVVRVVVGRVTCAAYTSHDHFHFCGAVELLVVCSACKNSYSVAPPERRRVALWL